MRQKVQRTRGDSARAERPAESLNRFSRVVFAEIIIWLLLWRMMRE